MKLIAYLLLALSAISGAFAVESQKSFIMTFPPGTAEAVVQEAMQRITDASGFITHVYSTVLTGFSATAGESVFDGLQTWAQASGAMIEEDKVVSIDKQHS